MYRDEKKIMRFSTFFMFFNIFFYKFFKLNSEHYLFVLCSEVRRARGPPEACGGFLHPAILLRLRDKLRQH